jgi:hypothetical protein
MGKVIHRRHERSPHLELDLGMGGQRDVSRAALVGATVVDGRHRPGRRPDLSPAEPLSPDVKEIAQRERPLDRRLDMDDPVSRMRVQPVEAVPSAGVRPNRSLGYLGIDDPNAARNPARSPVDVDGQMGVDVEEELLAPQAADAVHRRGRRCGRRLGQLWRVRDRHPFGTEGAGRSRRIEPAKRGHR